MDKMLETIGNYPNEITCDEIDISESETKEFLSFIESQQNFLDTGLGAFHTDDHSNW